MLQGGCFCGDVRYQTEGRPRFESICHCSMCRRSTGAPLVAWFTVARARFRFVRGTPTSFQSSDQATRRFCGRCGTQLTFEHVDYADAVDVTTSSLDDPNAITPRDHTYAADKLAWIRLADGLPEFRASRAEG